MSNMNVEVKGQRTSTTQSVQYNQAKTWQIGLFALNNTATNAAGVMIMYYAMFCQNVLGLSAVIIGFIATGMRVFDGITDPIVGYFLDKTNGRFGKFRPFMFIGNIIIVIGIIAIFNCPESLSDSGKYIYTTLWYVVYVIGYTLQTACTKGAQAVLTNDPKQRPVFTVFDSVYNTLLFNLANLFIMSIMAPKFVGGIIDPDLWKVLALTFTGLSMIFTIGAIIGIWKKDRPEFFGLGEKGQKVAFKDYWPIIKQNRAIQMLVIAASTDKMASTISRGVQVYLFGNLFLRTSLQGEYSAKTMVPILVLTICGVMLARKFGQKKAFLGGTWISMCLLMAMWIVGPDPENPWIYLSLMMVQTMAAGVSGNIVIPMIADCSDYEIYRSGRFVPGMMGTLFSFVDKCIAALATSVWGIMLGMIGLATTVITPEVFISDEFNTLVMVAACGIPILGHIASIVAMKFYPLDDKKMQEIQMEITRLKEAA